MPDTPFTALSRTFTGRGAMRVRVVLRSGAVLVGDALDGSDENLTIAVTPTSQPALIASDDIASIAIRESYWPRTVALGVGSLVVWPLLLAGFLEVSYVSPALRLAVGVGMSAIVLGLFVYRMPFVRWLGHMVQRWRQVYVRR